jgi:Glycosyl hydrolases family 28/MBG domain (YGX type)/Divergent InlB B-repeat domain/Bacterial Ig domain
MLRALTVGYRSISRVAMVSLASLLLPCLPAIASIALDTTSSQTGPAGSTSLTWTHVLGSGGNRMVVCGVTFGYNDTAVAAPLSPAPSMTFDGVAMTPSLQAPSHAQSSTAKIFSQIFYISDTGLGARVGSYTVAVTIPTAVTGGASAGCTSMFGVNQTAPEVTASGLVGGYSGSSTPAPSITLTTITAGDWVIDAFGGDYGTSGSAGLPGAGQTQLYNVQSAAGSLTTGLSKGGEISAGSYELVPTPGSVTVGWAPTVARYAYVATAFAPAATVNYTISTAANPVGSGTVTLNPNQASYPAGTSVQVTANPGIGYTFANFSGNLTGSTNPVNLIVNGNESVTANFTPTPCTLTINIVGSGTVTPASGSSYTCGTQVLVTATPGSGYSFGQFSGALTGSTNPQTITLNTNSTVTATFVQGTSCTLSTSVTGSGSITVSPSGTVFTCGTQLTITAVPATYFSLTGFGGALSGTTNPQTLTLNTNSSVSATFAQTSYPINITNVGPGTASANPADAGNGYAPGTMVQLTANPGSGAFFTGFSGDLTGTTNPQTLTVNSTRNVTANFVNSTITQDAVSHAASTATAASTLSWTHILGSGGSRAVVIAVGETDSIASPDANAVVSSVTFNGVYATPIPNSTIFGGTSGMVQTQLFYLLESELPHAGTYTIQVNLVGSIAGISAGAVSLIGVSQGPPEAVVTARNTSGADLLSASITTLTNNAWVVDLIEDNNVAALTANTGQGVLWTASAKLGTGGSSTKAVPTAGPTTLGWAGSASRLAYSLAAFPPATATIPATYTLTTSVAGGLGSIATNPSLSSYPLSTGVLLTATAQTGYAFSSWSGDYTSTANPLPITMDTNRNVVANFAVAATCNLTINVVGSGTVTPAAGTYNCGTVIHFVATPSAGFNFTSYSGDFSSVDNPADFTLSADSTVTVEFDAIPVCSLTVTTIGQGSVSPGTGTFACGAVLNLQATANSGNAFSGYSGDISTTANPATLILNQNTNITATFTTGTACTLTTNVNGQGTITPSSGSWACGTTIPIEADPASKYSFSGWTGDLSGTATPTTLTLNTSKNVTASFTVNIAGVTGDPRTVTEPVYPAVCTVLTAVQSSSSLVESQPDTARVQAAINACPAGQAVEFSASGPFNAFIIQPITLAAGVTMLVDPEITIYGSIRASDYACSASASWCNPLINVLANTYPAAGSGIMGLGVIDGRGGVPLLDTGKTWWSLGSNEVRPRLVFLGNHSTGVDADNFTMYKISLKNSPKFHFSGTGNDLTIWGVKVYAPPDSPNTDGIDPSGSQNITITNSYISDGDDMIAVKAGVGHVSNVTISNNHMYSGHGITVGSETNAGLNNMYVHDDAIDNGFGGSSLDSIRIKSDTSRGGEVYDVLYKNICIQHGGDTIVIDPYYSSQTGSLIPNFHDITFSNVHELIRDSAHKSTFTGYNTAGIVNPVTITMDNVSFDGAIANDFKAPDNINNAQFTLGPGPVNIASILAADAAVPSNLITVTNSVSNSNTPYDCTGAFVYLAGDLTAPTSTVAAGTSPKVTAVLQNVVSPLIAGTITSPFQNAPTGTINLLEGSTVVASGTISGRLASIPVPTITAGPHTYTAQYLGDGNFSPLSFGSFTLTAASAAPVANAQAVNVPFNTATPITLTATGAGTLTYSVVANPAHGTLTGPAPNLTYTPNASYTGADSFTFKANNGADSNVATISITVQSGSTQTSQTITFPAPSTPVTYGASSITLGATASSSLAVSYSVTGPGSLGNSTLSFTGAGSVVVTASQLGNTTYSAATPVQRTIVVNPATLGVGVVGSPSRIFGQPNPAFTYSIAPFVNGDTQASAITGAPTLTTTASPKSPAGPYTITVVQGTLAATNYIFNLTNGTLTVSSGAAQSVLFPALANFTHGTSVTLVAVATSGLPVTFNVTSGPASISGSTLTITGTGPVSVTASQSGDSNFSAASLVSRTFTAQ